MYTYYLDNLFETILVLILSCFMVETFNVFNIVVQLIRRYILKLDLNY